MFGRDIRSCVGRARDVLDDGRAARSVCAVHRRDVDPCVGEGGAVAEIGERATGDPVRGCASRCRLDPVAERADDDAGRHVAVCADTGHGVDLAVLVEDADVVAVVDAALLGVVGS